MSRAVLLCAFFAAAATAVAGERAPKREPVTPEQDVHSVTSGMRMYDRWMRQPSEYEMSSYHGKSFEAGSSSIGKTSYFQDKEFHSRTYQGEKDFSTKEFYTSEWGSSKKGWWGSRAFETRQASLKRNSAPESEKSVETGTLEQRSARDANKGVETKDLPGREFAGKGKSQGILDQQNPSKSTLTVEQVREILNKSK
jgi:hypothetical protein